jgi:hypothetical protein
MTDASTSSFISLHFDVHLHFASSFRRYSHTVSAIWEPQTGSESCRCFTSCAPQVLFPYAPMTHGLSELYALEVPLFVPDPEVR